MKIDFVISSLTGGGAERVLSILANSFAKRSNYQITIITLLNDTCAYDIDKSITRVTLTKNKKLIGHTLGSIINLTQYYKSKSNRPDFIISFMTLNSLIALLPAKLYNIKVMAQEHTHHEWDMEGRGFISRFTKKYIYRWASIVTVLTSYDLNFYKSRGINVMVLPNPCGFKALTKAPVKNQKVILAIGDLERYDVKGFDNLLMLIAPVLHQHKDWILKIAGSGDTGLAILKKLATENDISDKVEFTGFVNDIPALMSKSSIFVLSSRTEGLPMGLIEAMSQGMACIAYDCVTGPSDIITHEVDGLLIPNQDHSEMQKGIETLINHEELRAGLGTNALKASKKYEISEIINVYEELFKVLD
ncbi:glycosyltransferase family 4 protein [Winogradskyella sp.]|uniref:glycosyltransferase family 4 protein n=1 Tax=Winogradskyella sp. TaxID=1883156 RepID=UPI0026258E9F|nr:glycosyltransferase family 4 protein [Winogradskyella sp.]